MSFRGAVVCLSPGLTPKTVAQMCETLWNYSWVWLPVKLNLRCQFHVAGLPLLRLAGCREWQAGCWLFQSQTPAAPRGSRRPLLFVWVVENCWFVPRRGDYYAIIAHFCMCREPRRERSDAPALPEATLLRLSRTRDHSHFTRFFKGSNSWRF